MGEPNRLVPGGHRGYTLIRNLKMGRKIPWISEHDGSNLALAVDSSWTADNARKGTQISGEGVAMEGADQTSAVRVGSNVVQGGPEASAWLRISTRGADPA